MNTEKDIIVDSYFPLRYAWYINGEESGATVYDTINDIDGAALGNSYKEDHDAFFKRLDRLDWAEKHEAKEWLYNADYKNPGWPDHFALIRDAGTIGKKIIFEGSNASEYTTFDKNRKNKKETFAEKVSKMDEAFEDDELFVGDVPFEKPLDINITFYEGTKPIDNLSVHANSLKDLINKTDNIPEYPLSYKDWIKNIYYGKGWYSAGEDLSYYVNALFERFTGDWKLDYKSPYNQSGLLKIIAEESPEDLDSRWFSYSVVVNDHLAAFDTFDLLDIIEDKSKITFNLNEKAPTEEDLGLNFPPYYAEDEKHSILPSIADWETEGSDIFPFAINVKEDNDYDFDNSFYFDNQEEFEEFLNDIPSGMDNSVLNFKGTKKEAQESLKKWFDNLVIFMKENILQDTANTYSDEDAPEYRWLTLILFDSTDDEYSYGDVISYKNIDMLEFFKKAGINEEILEELNEVPEPSIPNNIA